MPLVTPHEKCRSYASREAAVKAADTFMRDTLGGPVVESRRGIHWVVVPIEERWTVLVFITEHLLFRYARVIAEHRWKVTA